MYALIALSLLYSNDLFAAPVLNVSAPAGMDAVIHPDHADPNRYYLNPTRMAITTNDKGVPYFLYQEFFVGQGRKAQKAAVIQLLVRPMIDSPVRKGMEEVLKHNPQATFSPIPFIAGKLVINGMNSLIAKGACSGASAGGFGQDQDCVVRLTPTGRMSFLPHIKRGHTITVHLDYTVTGVIQQGDKSYKEAQAEFGVGGFIEGGTLKQHPELFRLLR